MPSSAHRPTQRPAPRAAGCILIAGGAAEERSGLRESVAATARVAIAIDDGALPDPTGVEAAIVVVDGPDAVATAWRLRRLGCPILALAPDGGGDLRHAALRLGAAALLDRSATPRLVQARLRAILRDRDDVGPAGSSPEPSLGFAEPAAPFDAARPGLPHIVAVGRDAGATADLLRAATGLTIGLAATPAELAPEAPPTVIALSAEPGSSDALGLLAELRTHPLTRDAATLVLLGRAAGDDLAALALDLGAGDVLPAPAPAAEIVAALQSLLARQAQAAAARARMQARLDAALVDPLTGLSNRRHAEPEMRRIADQAARTGKGYAVLVVDIDHFKRVNDRHGHVTGDAVLVEVARRIRDAARPGDLVARIGGEEFVVVAPDIGADEANGLAQAVRHAVSGRSVRVETPRPTAMPVALRPAAPGPSAADGDAQGPVTGSRVLAPPGPGFLRAAPALPPSPIADLLRPLPLALPVTVSVGVALAPPGTRSDCLTEVYAQADAALYSAKAGGRNLVAVAP